MNPKPRNRGPNSTVQEDRTMKKHMQMMVCAVALVAIGAFAVPPVFGLGFDNPDQDARATGQGEAFVAQADDASAIFYNPAGLTQLKGTEITSGMMVSFPDSRLQGGGPGTEMKDRKSTRLNSSHLGISYAVFC